MVTMSTSQLSLEAVNAMDEAAFLAALGAVFEHSPWIAEGAFGVRPFRSLDALHAAMMDVLRKAPKERQVDLLRAHPELAGREAQEGALTEDSTSEQLRLGFNALGKDELARMTLLNEEYREKFGFPCIIALRRHATRQTVQAEHVRRLGNGRDAEIAKCIDQIGIITLGRLYKLFGQVDGAVGGDMSAIGLTTHVLDAVHGAGAAGVRVNLHRLEGEHSTLACSAVTRDNGRAQLLDAEGMTVGEYEVVFAIADYFRSRGVPMVDPSFLEDVPVRFVITDARGHYHVPLIASPWAYSTYRGGLPPKGE
jgi:2-oxo-4-hydroxy-4-carboxy-5-ureidoimidazoline decarboxylase